MERVGTTTRIMKKLMETAYIILWTYFLEQSVIVMPRSSPENFNSTEIVSPIPPLDVCRDRLRSAISATAGQLINRSSVLCRCGCYGA